MVGLTAVAVQDVVESMTWLTVDHPSSYHARNSAVPDASQTLSTSDLSDPVAMTRA